MIPTADYMNETKESSVVLFSGLSLFGEMKEELLKRLVVLLEESPQVGERMVTVFTPNPEQLVLAGENKTFRTDLESATFLLPDGAGLVWAIHRVKGKGQRVRRIAGREVFHELLELSKEKQYRVFLLGGKVGAASSIAAQCQMSNAKCQIEYDDGPKENREEILKKIVEFKPDLLFVAYGAPYQEHFVTENRQILEKAGVRVAMVVGGAFEYESGMIPAVPQIVADLHLEWLQRLLLEPSRWRRQLKGLKFFWWVITGKM